MHSDDLLTGELRRDAHAGSPHLKTVRRVKCCRAPIVDTVLAEQLAGE